MVITPPASNIACSAGATSVCPSHARERGRGGSKGGDPPLQPPRIRAAATHPSSKRKISRCLWEFGATRMPGSFLAYALPRSRERLHATTSYSFPHRDDLERGIACYICGR